MDPPPIGGDPPPKDQTSSKTNSPTPSTSSNKSKQPDNQPINNAGEERRGSAHSSVRFQGEDGIYLAGNPQRRGSQEHPELTAVPVRHLEASRYNGVYERVSTDTIPPSVPSRRKRQGEDRSTQTTINNNNQPKSGKRSPEKSGKYRPQDQRHSGSSQDSAGQVVRRQQKDADAHLRRGSLKSRIFQFKKGRGKRSDNGNDTTDNAANIHSRSDLLTLHNQSALNIQNYDKEPVSARQQRAPLVVSLRDNTPPTPSRQPTPPTAHEQQPIYAKPVKKQFRIYPEDRIEHYHGRGTSLLDKENARIEPLKLSPHAKEYHEIRRPLGLSIPAPNSPTKPSPRFSQVTDLSGNSGLSSESIPSSPRNQDTVVLRRQPTANPEAGRLLKSALARHFRNQHCSLSGKSTAVGNVLSKGLDEYIREIFRQLDYKYTGTVTREDFTLLCEVLGLSTTPPTSKRNSGLEWLASYRPRPNSPGSPLRLDKLKDVKYKHNGPKPLVKENPTSFLWTIGPRPFWELWPAKKRRKKHLNVDEFAKCLLEQWAKTYGYPTANIQDNVLASLRDQAIQAENTAASSSLCTVGQGVATCSLHHQEQGEVSLSSDESRSRRLMRSIARASRRYHILERLSRRPQTQPTTNGDTNGHIVNGNAHANGSHMLNGHNGVANEYHNARVNGASQRNGVFVNGRGGDGARTPPLPESIYQELSPPQAVPTPKIRLFQSSHSKAKVLQAQNQHQLQQLNSLREVIEDLRSSLQLSDAQNLALQVSLRKLRLAEAGRRGQAGYSLQESEIQLENLVKELKMMSETEYPTMSSQLSSSCTPGVEDELAVFTTSLDNTVSTLTNTQRRLDSAHLELATTARKLLPGSPGYSAANGGRGPARSTSSSPPGASSFRLNGHGTSYAYTNGRDVGSNSSVDKECMKEAHKALHKAQVEIQQLRESLESAQKALEQSRSELDTSLQEYHKMQTMLTDTKDQLSMAEMRAVQLNQNRRSLLCELQSTKEVLISSLNKVHHLEIESRKVPVLQQKVQELERRVASRKSDLKAGVLIGGSGVRPLSTIDSGLYSTDSTDSDQDQDKSKEQGSDDDSFGARDSHGLPPRPPSSRSRDKSSRSITPSSAMSERSPRPTTPSSGHHSAGSKLSASPQSPPQMRSPDSTTQQQSPEVTSLETSKSTRSSEINLAEGSVLPRLRKEIESLKKKFLQAETEWNNERSTFIEELTRRRDDFGEITTDLQVLEAERFRLSLLEDKVKEVLGMLKTLNNMKISQSALGKLVLEAVDKSVDPMMGEIQVFKFLNCLYQSTREYERLAADNLLTQALEAVEDANSDSSTSSTSSESLGVMPEGMDTIRPRKVRVQAPNPTFDIDT